jgi:mRNA-degrading endonuclease RelE of RelBE toxin-antitoxin system
MVAVRLALDAQEDFDVLPATMRARVLGVFERLQQWPNVSGAKALRGDWIGHYRIRTGDWRIIFQVVAPTVIVVCIKHRSEVYEG